MVASTAARSTPLAATAAPLAAPFLPQALPRICQLRTVAFALLIPSLTLAQAAPCDSNLERRSLGPHGYALRGERCEGIYVKEVGGTVLTLASFTESFEPYDSTTPGLLVVEWTAPGGDSLRLRARGIRQDLYYQMDVVRPSGRGSHRWQWPTDVLSAQRIGRSSIGVVAWTQHVVGEVRRDLYIPLRVTREGDSSSGSYELILYPGVRLAEVYVTLAAVGPDGKPTGFVRRDEPLGYGYYPAEHPIRVPISDLRESGIYSLEIGARLTRGGSAALTLFFHHPMQR